MEKSVTISATDITNCLRGVVFKKQQRVAPPLHPEVQKTLDFFRTLADLGQRIQERLTQFWREKGSLVSSGDFIPSEAHGFTGRFDAICTIGGKLVLYEVKGAGASFFQSAKERKEPRSYHRLQLMIYHRALRDRFPDLAPRILYVARKPFAESGKLAGVEIPIRYTEEDFQKALGDANAVRAALTDGPLPPAAPVIEQDPVTGRRDVSLNAITCRHHALCVEDPDWYVKAKRELGLPVEDHPVAEAADEEEVPF